MDFSLIKKNDEIAELQNRVRELEKMLRIAGETLMMLNDHTHPNIECDGIGQECLDLAT